MNIDTFFVEIKRYLEYLAEGSYSFEEYLELSHENRRVRNGFVFFALSNNTSATYFFKLASTTSYVNDLKEQLYKALVRASETELIRPEAVKIAHELLATYFFDEEPVTVDFTVYDDSAEMAKFLIMVVHHHCLKQEDTEEKRKYREKILKNVDWDHLFISNKDNRKDDV